jgi:hypothetical protein
VHEIRHLEQFRALGPIRDELDRDRREEQARRYASEWATRLRRLGEAGLLRDFG